MRKFLFLVAVAGASPVGAQTTLPGLENFTLERPQPTPTVTPPATPSPTPSPSVTTTQAPPAPATAEPRPTTRRMPSAEPTALPRPTATASASPIATPTAAPPPALPTAAVDSTAPTPTPTETAPVATSTSPEPATAPSRGLLWLALAVVVLAALGGLAWWRNREVDVATDDVVLHEPPAEGGAIVPERGSERPVPPVAPLVAPPPVATPAVSPPPPPPSPSLPGGLVTSSLKPGGLVTSALKPELRIGLTPLRGGVDTLRATLEYDLHVGNIGGGTAHMVSVEAWLLSGSHQTAADLAAVFASPAGVPMLPPFDLTARAAIDLSGAAVSPRELLATITAGDRRMFVPILAVRASFVDARGTPQMATTAFLIGTERAGQDRLGPLPLDRGGGMNGQLAARPFVA